MSIVLEPIGIIHSPFTQAPGTPIQPRFAEGAEGTVEVLARYADGLADLEGFGRIWLVYWFDRAPAARLTVTPFMDDRPRGLFATRAPCRPNPIGLSPVRLLGVERCTLRVGDIDVLDGTPLLDVKPYSPTFDCFPDAAAGWMDQSRPRNLRADDRFAQPE